jgi:drug/metabolite transporter (DMT)-like permease
MTRRAWLLFVFMSLIWGLSYLFIKVADDAMPAIVVVAGRTGIAAVVLLPIALRAHALRAVRAHWRAVLVVTVSNFAAPLTLIAFGETRISSSLAGLLIATEPVGIALLAPLMGARRTSGRGRVGLLLGLAGVVVLLGTGGVHGTGQYIGAGMILLAVAGYSVAVLVVERHLSQVPPIGLVTTCLVISTLVLAPFALVDLPARIPDANALGALAALGALCTAAAFVAFYALIGAAGAATAALITYLNPVVALAAGVVVLGEPLTWRAPAGLVVILAGCYLATRGAAAARREPATGQALDGPAEPAAGSLAAGASSDADIPVEVG